MISCENLFQVFQENNIDFFTGVPDSTFKDWMSFLSDNHEKRLTNIIQASECEAIATATGYNLATNKLGVVYMQNSGLGKCVNPLTSLCDKEVYSIPLLMMIGWRGKPGVHDEPQHKKMGRIMLPLLDALEIEYKVMPADIEEARKIVLELKTLAFKSNSPVALIIQSDILEKYTPLEKPESNSLMSREEAINLIVENISKESLIISTTGKASRELFESRVKRQEKPSDFYTVGSMGCSSSIALGIALEKPEKKIFVLDGDGAAIMQAGALTTIGHYKPKNFYHIILDNQSYESTGNQPTVSNTLDFEKLALSCGYLYAKTVNAKEELIKELKDVENKKGPFMLIIKVNKNSRKDLGRPTSTPVENKQAFMDCLKK